MSNVSIEKAEEVLRKIDWAKDILISAQNRAGDDPQLGNILSGVAYIIDAAGNSAEELYQLVK